MRSTSATTVLETLQSAVRTWNPPQPWGVGYSGGRDSAVLLWAVAETVGPEAVTALWIDHGWRPADERAQESQVVASLCHRLGVSLRAFPPPAETLATEAGARAHRYTCFQAFADEHPGSPVWLAHHADDQAETILMRLLQGRSWQGLGGIPARRGPFLRPLLGLRAQILAQAAAELQLPYHEDSTNADLRVRRNFLRREVLPLVSQQFPGAAEALAAFGRVWRSTVPLATLSPQWTGVPGRWAVDAAVWDRWSVLERQAQLLAASGVGGEARLARRFLEPLTGNGRTSPGEGAGWSWSRDRDQATVRWERVVQRPAKEYFIQVVDGQPFEGDEFRLRWSTTFQPGACPVNLDPTRPWVCRTPVDGMRLASEAHPAWGKDERRRRLGSGRRLLILQSGLVRAAFELPGGRLVWSENSGGKLHNDRIFVTLERRSEYERR